MPIYNTSVPILTEAVDSILGQTFSVFEFIIIDDGSTNEAPAYLDSLTDPRVRIIRNNTNFGLTKSLNIGFRMAQGIYYKPGMEEIINIQPEGNKAKAYQVNK